MSHFCRHSFLDTVRNLGRNIVCAIAGAATALGAASVDERLAALERQVGELAGENQLLRARLAQAGDRAAPVYVRPEGREGGLTLGGLIHLHGEAGGAPDARFTGLSDRFQLRRMRVAIAGAFAEHVGFKVESDFGNAAIAGKSGSSGQLTDACVTWTRYSAVNVRVGQFKTPFGYEQLVSDAKTLFAERTLVNDRLTVGRQIGAQASGDIVPKVLCYSLGVFNGTGTNTGANDNAKFLNAGRVVATVYSGTVAGAAVRLTTAGNFFNTVDRGTFSGRRTAYGFDSQLGWGAAQVGAEWLRQEQHPLTGSALAADGWYLFGAWNFTPQWQGTLRYEEFDAGTPRVDSTTREWTYGFNYYLKGDDVKLTLNYQAGRAPAPAPSASRLLGRVQVVF